MLNYLQVNQQNIHYTQFALQAMAQIANPFNSFGLG
jgi:hypothetical protein